MLYGEKYIALGGGGRYRRADQRFLRRRRRDAPGPPPLPLGDRKAFATSVAVILPLCALSSVIYLLRGGLDLMQALPYLLGGCLGGILGGKLFKKLNMLWLRRIFALFILYAGVQAAFFR